MKKNYLKNIIGVIFYCTIILFASNLYANVDVSMNVKCRGVIDTTALIDIHNIWGWENETTDSLYSLVTMWHNTQGGLAIINCTTPDTPYVYISKIIQPDSNEVDYMKLDDVCVYNNYAYCGQDIGGYDDEKVWVYDLLSMPNNFDTCFPPFSTSTLPEGDYKVHTMWIDEDGILYCTSSEQLGMMG